MSPWATVASVGSWSVWSKISPTVELWTCISPIWGKAIVISSGFPGVLRWWINHSRSLIQILDSEMYDLMHAHGDYTHFYFCYRWFLLDFKRELIYADIFSVWEVIWAAKHVASAQFVLFLALALLETYRDIILSNSMDFTDIIKFFNGNYSFGIISVSFLHGCFSFRNGWTPQHTWGIKAS